MNRAEKRNQEKMYKKKMQWAESLRPWQKEFINDALADARATIETEVVSNLDTIITAALVEKTDLSLKEIFDINVTVGEFYGRIRYENSIKGFENRMKTLASIQEDVTKRINEMIKEGKERGPIVKAIREEFKGTGLTTAEINVAYKKCLENAEKEEEYLAAKKILSIIGENVDDCSEEVEETEVKADDPVVEEKNDEEAERIEVAINKVKEIEAKSKKSKSKLKIVNKVTKIISMDVQGEFGLYHIEDGKVQMGTDIFENIEEVEVWAKEHIDTTEEKIRSLEREISAHKQQIEFLNNSKNEAIEVVENYLTK